MSEPQPAPAPSPWNPTPTASARSGPGCSKPFLIGCGVVLLLFGLCAVIFMVKMPAIVQWGFEHLETSLEPRLPLDATTAERARFHAAFAATRRAFANGTVDAPHLQAFQSRLLSFSSSEQRMTHDQLRDLSVSLEQLAGVSHKDSAAPPAASGPTGPAPPR